MILSKAAFIVYFDMAALLLLSVILLTIFVKGLYKQKESKIFTTLVICVIIDIVFDILASYPDMIGYEGLIVLDTLYFLFRVTIPFLYFLYLLQLTDIWFKFDKIYKKLLVAIPYWASLILIIINAFSQNLIFNINPNTLEYTRKSIFWVIYGVQGLYLILGLVLILQHRKIFNAHQKFTLIAIVPLTFGASIIQYFYGTFLVELFCQSIAIYLISSSIETKEMLIDDRTRLFTFSSFRSFIRRAYLNKRETHILLLKVLNYSELYNLLPYEDAIQYLRRMSYQFSHKYKNIDENYNSYYLDEGLFAEVSYSYDALKEIAIKMNKELGSRRSSIVEFVPKKTICLLTIPKVFDNETNFLQFINNFHTKLDFDHEIIYLNELYRTNEFIIRNNLDSILEQAFKDNEFEVYYQPIYNIKEQKFTSAEALVRLNSKKYGFIYPDLFINYAEKNGKIADIDRKVFYQVLDFINSNTFNNLGLEYIEINLSILEFIEEDIIENMTKALRDRNISIDKLNIEITEKSTSSNIEVDKHIIALAKRGIRLSLDDYGTGYSNIERFSKLPFELIKVDKSLVDDSEKPNMQRILKNTFNMIKDLKRKSVVEGVETKEQAERFISYGCDYIQGFYYSKPLTLEQFIKFIKNHNK